MNKDITTIADLQLAINRCTIVYSQVRLGNYSKWIITPKKHIQAFLKHIDKDATPDQLEMPSGKFGTVEDYGTILYFGGK